MLRCCDTTASMSAAPDITTYIRFRHMTVTMPFIAKLTYNVLNETL
jgi:hypothetical protein